MFETTMEPESPRDQGMLKEGCSFNEVVEAVAANDQAVTEIPVNDARQLRFSPDGILYEGRVIPVGDAARSRLFSVVHAPVAYWEEHSPEFQTAALAEHNRRGDFGATPSLVLDGDGLITISRGKLNALRNGLVLRSIAEALGPDGDGLFFNKNRPGPEPPRISRLSARRKQSQFAPAMFCDSGLHIVHERFGAQATVIEAFIYRLVCSNGLTQRECAGRAGFMRTRRLPLDSPNGIDLQLAQITRLTEQTWNGLQGRLDALKATSDRPADVPQLLRQWLRQARISDRDLMDRLLAAWRREGAEGSIYAAVNALSDVGTHDRDLVEEERQLSERQRRALTSLAGLLSYSAEHLCPRCFSVLAAATTRRSQRSLSHLGHRPLTRSGTETAIRVCAAFAAGHVDPLGFS